jgi:hypothetical protein
MNAVGGGALLLRGDSTNRFSQYPGNHRFGNGASVKASGVEIRHCEGHTLFARIRGIHCRRYSRSEHLWGYSMSHGGLLTGQFPTAYYEYSHLLI